jgi:hypothetical protein
MSEHDPDQHDSPPPLSYERRARPGRFASWLSAWARDTFSREQLLSSLKSFLWVAPLTILIWVYAEREQADKIDNQVIIFSLTSNDPRNLVTLITPQEPSLMAELRGSRIQLEAVKKALDPRGGPPVTISLSAELYKAGGGPYTVPASIIGDHDIFSSNNVTVSNISPAQLKFNVDQLVTEELAVQTPPLTNFPNLAGSPVIEPLNAQVTGPKSLLDIEKQRGELRVVADFSSYGELKTPGTHTLTVPLTMPFTHPNLTIQPSSAKVTLTVQELTKEFRKEAIPIYATYPHGLAKLYTAEYDESLRSVTFQGPPAVIAQMEQDIPAMQPKARFEVSRPTASRPAGTDVQTELKFDLPEGVRVSPSDAKRTITYKLVPLKPED